MFALHTAQERLSIVVLNPQPTVEASVFITYVDEQSGRPAGRKNVHMFTNDGTLQPLLYGPSKNGASRRVERICVHNRDQLPITFRFLFRGDGSNEDVVLLQRGIATRSTFVYNEGAGWEEVPESQHGPVAGSTLLFGAGSVNADTTTRRLYPGYSQQAAGPNAYGMLAPRDGTLLNLFARHNASVGNGNPVVYRVRVNGVDTALQCTVSTGAVGGGQDVEHFVDVKQGQLIEVVAVKNASLGNGAVEAVVSMQFTAPGAVAVPQPSVMLEDGTGDILLESGDFIMTEET